MPHAHIYMTSESPKRDMLDVKGPKEVELEKSYDLLTPLTVNGQQLLLGYTKADQEVDTYQLTDKKPWVQPVPNTIDLTSRKWDSIEPFVLANQPHLMCYQADPGWFVFFPIGADLSASKHMEFIHYRTPLTSGFSMVKALVAIDQVFFIGYDGTNGLINTWTLNATATSDPDSVPLVATPAWIHQWAKGWTRFAWFTWGGENFFLKTNTWKPNVNIDHLRSDLAQGSNEVGSHLELADAQELTNVEPFVMSHDEPHFVTYIKESGLSTLNRFHATCKDWTTVATFNAEHGAGHVVPYRIADQSFLLYA